MIRKSGSPGVVAEKVSRSKSGEVVSSEYGIAVYT